MIDWLKAATREVRWLEIGWSIALAVVVYAIGAPGWVAIVFGVWVLYKEME